LGSPAPGQASGAPAEALAVAPTCRGVPATIVGTDGNDRLVGTSGADVIVGGPGSDDIFGGRGDDLICGGPTRPRTFFGDPIFQFLTGGPGDDTVVGGRGPDEVFGDDGADVLIGKSGRDSMGGGDGLDSMRGGPGGDNLDGNGADDQLFGGQDGDFINDESGANTLMGGEGRDFILSGPGNETINGGSGRDHADYVEILSPSGSAGHCRRITADLSQGTASGIGFGVDVLQDIENISTGGGNDVLIGDDGPNNFYAGVPCFGKPSPTESVTGNGGVDRVLFSDPFAGESASGRVRVDLANHTARLGNDGGSPVSYSLDSIENVTGTEFRDVLLGDARPNLLDAGAFSSGDVIKGRGGSDELTGKFAGDRLLGGSGDDILLGNGGVDHLDGGPGSNRNDGGTGIDTCVRPSRGALAINCEQ
jgi:Ca2+-binding RTX toxin-like protein